MKLDDILSEISNLSLSVSQIKNDNLSNSLSIDQIRSSLTRSLKSAVTDVHGLILSLDSLSKNFAVNLVNSQEALSKQIDIVKSSASKRFDDIEERLTDLTSQMNSALSMLSKMSNDKIVGARASN